MVTRFERRGFAWALVWALLTSTVGCSVKAPVMKHDESLKASEDIAVTTQQIRLRTRAMIEPLSGVIVEAADRIATQTDDPAVRRAALLWKIEAIPALREALFRPNPYVAILDSWVLSWQMIDYFEVGDGREAMGTGAPVAAAACRTLESEIRKVAASMTVSGDVSKAAAYAQEWARDNPIRYSIASRETAVSRVGERELAQSLQATELAGQLVVTLDDVVRRMDVYTAQLFDQSRWQAELFTQDLAAEYRLHEVLSQAEKAVEETTKTLEDVRTVMPDVEQALVVAGSAPELVARERQAVLAAVDAEISRVLLFAQDERKVILDRVSQERDVVLTEVQRIIAAEREAAMADVERIASDLLERAMNRVARWIAVVLAAAFVGILVLLVLSRWLLIQPLASRRAGSSA